MVDALLWWINWTFKVVFYFFCFWVVVEDACKKFGRKP